MTATIHWVSLCHVPWQVSDPHFNLRPAWYVSFTSFNGQETETLGVWITDPNFLATARKNTVLNPPSLSRQGLLSFTDLSRTKEGLLRTLLTQQKRRFPRKEKGLKARREETASWNQGTIGLKCKAECKSCWSSGQASTCNVPRSRALSKPRAPGSDLHPPRTRPVVSYVQGAATSSDRSRRRTAQ